MNPLPRFNAGFFWRRSRPFLADPLGFSVQQAREIGDFFYMNLPGRRLYFVTNLEVVRHLLQAGQKNYRKSPAYHQLKLALGNGLVTSEGDFWRRQRRMAQPAFYKKELDGLFDQMVGVAQTYLEDLRTRIHAGQDEVDVSQEMMQVTSEMVLRTLFSSESNYDKAEIYQLIMEAQEYVMYRTIYPLRIPLTYLNGRHRRFQQQKAKMDAMVYQMIEEGKAASSNGHNLLALLLRARDAETGEGMSNRQLRDEAVTIFSAGHETSANAMAWTLYLLSQHPDALLRLQAEIHRVLAGRAPRLADLAQLTYTNQVLQEAMRLYPPAYFIGRMAEQKDTILGYPIPKRSIFVVSVYAIHRDPRHWEDPEAFRPERFANDYPKLAYLPFGAGPRMCIGNHFAMMEMQLLLAMLVQGFTFELLPGQQIQPQPLVTLRPKNGIRMKAALCNTSVT